MENKKNKIGFYIFIIILLFIAIGGYFGMKYLTSSSEEYKPLFSSFKEDKIDNRVDKNKDYIYYENVDRVLSYLEIDYQDVYINLSVANEINSTLNQETLVNKNTIKYIKDNPITEKTEYEENEEGIYSLTYREYEDYEYNDYLSLLVKDIDYNVIDFGSPKLVKSYNFNIKENKIVTEEQLFEKYNTNMNTIKGLIKTKLVAIQETVDGEPIIKVDDTINNLKYGLFINKIGKLEICYIVQSTKQNYYDNIVIN